MRARCIRLSGSTYKNFVARAELNIKRNSKLFWSFINKLPLDNTISLNMHVSETHVSDSESIVNLFAHYFGSVCNMNTLEDITLAECDSTLENIVISADQLYKVVCELEANTNPGPDGIPAYFVKECWASLQSPILHILNESLRQGSFPSVWMHSFVVPIFKAGDRQDMANYRPILILSTLAKIMDCIVSRRIMEFLGPKVAGQQHGFVKGRSTVTNLLLFSNYMALRGPYPS